MATHALGKLKFNLSGDGLAFRWGDGEVHRIGGKKDTSAQDQYEDEYSQYDDAGEEYEGYDDRGADDYADEDYREYEEYDDRANDAGDDDGYYEDDGRDPGYDDDYRDDGYDDRDYDDRDYDDRDYDDGYDDRGDYDDPGYDDGYQDRDYDDRDYDDGYDDRYSDEDAGDYGREGDYYEGGSPLMQYVDENDWVTYLLLFLFPPLGIYLLWRRQKFDTPIRWAISAVSAIWFIVALWLLFSHLFGSRETTVNPELALPSLSPSVTVTATPAPEDAQTGTEGVDSASAGTQTADEATPAPTALVNTALTGDYVYSPPTGQYYHASNTCENIDESVRSQLSRVSITVAENSRRQVKCPVCFVGVDTTTYYGRRDGTYYHTDPTCSGMSNATELTKDAAERLGLRECPVCILHTMTSLEETKAKLVRSGTTDKSNIRVWYRPDSTNYHVTQNCRNMSGATQHSLKDALIAGKTACATCCPTAGTLVYTRSDGTYYHVDSTCSGMRNATQVTLAEALVLGKQKCPTCIGTAKLGGVGGVGTTGEVMVWGTKNGQYYHTNATCSGMTNAQQYSLKAVLQAGRPPCPVCASSANTTVYATAGGTYYHSYATCSGMTNAVSGTLAQALAYGKQRCPRCWGTATAARANTGGAATTVAATPGASTATAENTYVYATRDGTWYHLKDNCSGMKNATRVPLKTAINAGKTACPTCATAANRVVYSTQGGKYYHAAATCDASGMKNGVQRTLAQALMLNQTACPQCLGANAVTTTTTVANTPTTAAAAGIASITRNANGTATVTTTGGTTVTVKNTYRSGTSGIKVYATAGGQHFHTRADCSGMQDAVQVTLETALNYGKTACPTCASAASRTVYATQGGKYYHYYRADAGNGAVSGTLAQALAMGYDACPVCVTRTAAPATAPTGSSGRFTSGTSGVKVYATLNGAHYHSRANCSGMTNALHVTLETALNYGKTACPTCMAIANRTVYGTANGTYYHYNKAHAGDGALTSTLAIARALGLKPCPTCGKSSTTATISGFTVDVGTAGGAESTVYYAADASTSVYIEIASMNIYYHKASRCNAANFAGGTAVTLQYAKDWGYRACPYCNPPTSVGSVS